MPSAKGMLRMERLGVIDNLIKASQSGALVKIMCPIVEENFEIAKCMSDQAPSIQIMNINDTPAGLLIVDNEKLFQAEVKEPKAGQFTAAIGFAIYSNSRHNINSFKSFYELLWNQAELYEKSKKEFSFYKR
jgi:two-component system, OmpR family, sensor histidine kinase VicK